jgi:hypothetical protein
MTDFTSTSHTAFSDLPIGEAGMQTLFKEV